MFLKLQLSRYTYLNSCKPYPIYGESSCSLLLCPFLQFHYWGDWIDRSHKTCLFCLIVSCIDNCQHKCNCDLSQSWSSFRNNTVLLRSLSQDVSSMHLYDAWCSATRLTSGFFTLRRFGLVLCNIIVAWRLSHHYNSISTSIVSSNSGFIFKTCILNNRK